MIKRQLAQVRPSGTVADGATFTVYGYIAGERL
jgi:hypothetical protein